MKETLEKLGLSDLQARVYLALIDLGKSGVNDIAKECATYRANVYDALERLQDMGFVTFVHEGGKKMFMPVDPNNFPMILDEIEEKKKDEFGSVKSSMLSIMPLLSAKYEKVQENEEIEIYKGKEGYRAMMREYMRSGFKSARIFGQLNSMKYFEFDWKKWAKHYKNFKIILPNTEETRERANILKSHMNGGAIDFKFAPKEMYSPTTWAVGGDEMFQIIIWSKNPTVISIRSKEVVKMYSKHFDMLWDMF